MKSDAESFIVLTEDQVFSPNIDAIIPSTDLVQFGAVGTSTVPNNLTTILNSKLGVDNTGNLGVKGNLTVQGSIGVNGDLWSAGNISTGSPFYSTMSRNEGGQLSLLNPIKTNIAGLADNWTLFNMTDKIADKWKYPNGLNFYKYGKDLTTGPAQFILLDNGTSIFNGPVTVGTKNKHTDDLNDWWMNKGTGTFVVRCDSIEPKDGCLKIETSEWMAGAVTKTFSTINSKGRLHLYSDEAILLIAKNVVIHKREDIGGATGNLTVQGSIGVKGDIVTTGGSLVSSLGTNEGGSVTLGNSLKLDKPGLVSTWKIWNMTDLPGPAEWKYPNGLHFWKYGTSLNSDGAQLILYDNNTSAFAGPLNVAGNLTVQGTLMFTKTQADGGNYIDGGEWFNLKANRVHLQSTVDNIYLMPKGSVIIHKSDFWGGSGNLTVENILQVGGDISTTGGMLYSSMRANVGGSVGIGNPLKQDKAGLVHTWKIWNMTDVGPEADKYSNGLHFWKYGTSLNHNGAQLSLLDNNTSAFSGVVSASNIPASSDRRLKENIKNISENDKDKVLKLVPKTYNFIDDKTKLKRYGLIAQEVEELYPELVLTNSIDGMKSMNYIELIPLLLEQIKELKKSIPNPETVNTNVVNSTVVNSNVLNIGGVTLTANELLKLKQLLNM